MTSSSSPPEVIDNSPAMDAEAKATDILTTTRFIGQVKWFNITSGYGFITACNNADIFPKNEKGENDVFVHFSSIRNTTTKTGSPFLMQGEYVEFSVIRAETPKVNKDGKVYEYHADDITGLFRGTLFCDHFNYNHFLNYVGVGGGGVGGGVSGGGAAAAGRRRGGVSSGDSKKHIGGGPSKIHPSSNNAVDTTADEGGEFQKVTYKRILTAKTK